MISLGVALGLSTLASLALSPLSAAQAAYTGWSPYAAPSKRPQFRPMRRVVNRATPVARWRPHGQASSARQVFVPAATRRAAAVINNDRRMATPRAFAAERTTPRKAPPVNRGQELGLRFRPDHRRSRFDQSGGPDDAAPDAYQRGLHAQFRPATTRPKRTYEQLQAQRAGSRNAAAGRFAPMARLPGYPRYWRGW